MSTTYMSRITVIHVHLCPTNCKLAITMYTNCWHRCIEKNLKRCRLNSLRPRTIRNWAELQAEFSKKFFSAHKTNNLKRKIYTFAAHDSERFYQCWERYLETINACPHHGFDTWMLVNHFYDGMSSSMKRLLETMCGGGLPQQKSR